ncbi:MAG: hypothetical protein JSS43_03470 [Proteobacteria bacterium]|nr:hypothetical protein [Pseudomonadota bacterium]
MLRFEAASFITGACRACHWTSMALFSFHRMKTGSAVAALQAAGSLIYGLLRRTAEAWSREILTVTVVAKEEFVTPTRLSWAAADPGSYRRPSDKSLHARDVAGCR